MWTWLKSENKQWLSLLQTQTTDHQETLCQSFWLKAINLVSSVCFIKKVRLRMKMNQSRKHFSTSLVRVFWAESSECKSCGCVSEALPWKTFKTLKQWRVVSSTKHNNKMSLHISQSPWRLKLSQVTKHLLLFCLCHLNASCRFGGGVHADTDSAAQQQQQQVVDGFLFFVFFLHQQTKNNQFSRFSSWVLNSEWKYFSLCWSLLQSDLWHLQ